VRSGSLLRCSIFPPDVQQERAVGHVDQPRALDGVDRLGDALRAPRPRCRR